MIISKVFFSLVRYCNVTTLTILSIIASIVFKDILPNYCTIIAYTAGNGIKNILIFLIPFLILPQFIRSIIEIRSKGLYLLLLTFVLIFLSNIISLTLSYIIGLHIIPSVVPTELLEISSNKKILSTLYDINLPEILTIPQTILIGICTGLIMGYFHMPRANKVLKIYFKLSNYLFKNFFLRLIPIYIFGSILKIVYEINFVMLLSIFNKIMLLIVLLQVFYLLFLFFIACEGNGGKAYSAIKNSMPAGVLGFLTMSSLATLPVTLEAAKKNTQNSKITNIIISSTVNAHDIGGCISMSMLVLTILYLNNLVLPDFITYFQFILLVAFAQFSSVSVPCGSIIIILPFLHNILGFTDGMVSLIIALSILLEPIETGNNVMGNSVFVIFINKIWKTWF